MSLPPAFRWFEPRLRVDDHRFVVHGEHDWVLFRYVTGSGADRPHGATLCGASGRNVLEDAPVDHLHHHGLWWGHGDVNGVDYCLELPGGEGPADRGSIVHVDWLEVLDDAPRFGFVEDVSWRDHRGEETIREQRMVTLDLGTDEAFYTLDLDSTYVARVDLTFGDTKESVLPGVRPVEALTGAAGATITNSEAATGEDQTFGQPARWVDVAGTRRTLHVGGDVVEGVAILDHPGNPGHPQRFFTREYGPISPFPGHHFHDDRELRAGDALRLRHRLVVHRGTADEADVAAHHARYAET